MSEILNRTEHRSLMNTLAAYKLNRWICKQSDKSKKSREIQIERVTQNKLTTNTSATILTRLQSDSDPIPSLLLKVCASVFTTTIAIVVYSAECRPILKESVIAPCTSQVTYWDKNYSKISSNLHPAISLFCHRLNGNSSPLTATHHSCGKSLWLTFFEFFLSLI